MNHHGSHVTDRGGIYPQLSELCKILFDSTFFRRCLQRASEVDLPEWWLCGGIIRETVWARVSDQPAARVADVDLIYFDKDNDSRPHDRSIEASLNRETFDIPWSIKNQSRMWMRARDYPYNSSLDGLIAAPDSVSSIGIKKIRGDKLQVFAPYGLEDLFQMRLAPTEVYLRTHEISEFHTRIDIKGWLNHWAKVSLTDEPRKLSYAQPFEWYEPAVLRSLPAGRL